MEKAINFWPESIERSGKYFIFKRESRRDDGSVEKSSYLLPGKKPMERVGILRALKTLQFFRI